MKETIPLVQVDAFTDRPFGGNPAAVCITPQPLPDSLMQLIASEMNLAETAFLVREDKGFHLRWFTPTTEVELCGHATLASAHVLWEKGLLSPDENAVFQTLSGELIAHRQGKDIVLDFPARPAGEVVQAEVKALFPELNIRFLGRSDDDYLVVLDDEEALIGLTPDFNRMAKIEARGFIVTARSASSACHYISRFFAPACGINEDPVTGSAHCTLAPYWSEIMGSNKLTGYQASARGGYVDTEYLGARVKLKGKAVTVMHAEMLLPKFEQE